LKAEIKQHTIAILRGFGLIKLADLALFKYSQIRNKKPNSLFLAENADIKLPPDYMMYESFQLNYSRYFHDSFDSAQELVERIQPYIDLSSARILDWGCGPGRMVRHLPAIVNGANVFGTDYNASSISWCKENIEAVQFFSNEIEPPLAFEAASFDFIYGISIFTHLSEELHKSWLDELYRLMAKDAVLYLTTHGDSFRRKLTKKELALYDDDQIATRGNTIEGHRSYVAFQSPNYFKTLLNRFEILEFRPGSIDAVKPQQDEWILRKN
jgi:SAM-dependent methyltransferase